MFEAINDQLDWLYGEMDLLLPSLYGMGALTPAAIWIHHLCLTDHCMLVSGCVV